jgi:hypothetical protein
MDWLLDCSFRRNVGIADPESDCRVGRSQGMPLTYRDQAGCFLWMGDVVFFDCERDCLCLGFSTGSDFAPRMRLIRQR